MIRNLLLAAAASVSFTACSTMGDMGAPMAAAMPLDARGYTAMAASSDMYEIESSRLALQRSQNAQVRQFAQMMIQHHSNTTEQLMAAARAAGVMPPMQMMPMHARMLQELQAAGTGMRFDATYGRQQRMAHEQALALHGNYAARGDTPALRTVAAAATPIVRSHLEMSANLPR